ncbi:FIST signal transduction protein [Mucisphaera calidilacus]|uniref:FIST N domain protein n=1 Tax=Mucisphaera calidilacus TaxID=2527982 RepID=A0A518BZ20_9BACT|nr:FIST N-terminal domain-containing protein [Mucisphaera calidilacus]QDU72204.1 FIST N domain protein [Mucisphaera calidilacus]
MSQEADPNSIRFATAITREIDPIDAGHELVAQILDAGLPSVSLLTLFFTANHVAAIDEIRAHLLEDLRPGVLLGMSASGVIFGREEIEDDPAVVVQAASLPGCRVQPFQFGQIDWDDDEDDDHLVLADELGVEVDGDERLVIALADPFSTPLVKTLPALKRLVGDASVVGGLSSGARQPRRNRLLLNDRILNEGAAGVLLSGAIDTKHTVTQGCRAVGRPYVITKSKRHIVQELGGQNALAAIKGMVGDLEPSDQQLVEGHGLLIGRVVNEYKDRFGPGDFVIRGLVGVDQDEGYVAVGDPQVTVGQTVQFHVRDQQAARGDFDLLLEAQRVHGPAAGALLFTCNGRGTNLYDEPNIDATLAMNALGDPPMIGAVCAGEIGPIGGRALVHGHTAVLSAFRGPDCG